MKHLFFLAIGLLLAFSLPAQKVVEGTVTYTYTLSGPGGAELGPNAQMMQGMLPERMTTTYGPGGIITRMEGGMLGNMMGHIVVNADKQEVYVLQDQQKVAYVMERDEMEASAEQGGLSEWVELDETEEILGYTCQKYTMTMEQQGQRVEQVFWVTDELRMPEYDMPGLERFNAALAGATLPGFPMQTLITLPGLNMGMLMTATGLSFEPVGDELFDLPEGYEVKAFSELAQGGFGGN